MDLLTALKISSAGLAAQRIRLNVLASNLANASSTKNAEGTGPYQRKDPLFKEIRLDSFDRSLSQQFQKVSTVEVSQIVEDQKPGPRVYDPSHPDADSQGYVQMPNVNVVTELTDIMATSRAYEANISAMRATKEMIQAALSIGRTP